MTPDSKSTWLFSATMPREVATIAKKFMHQPREITVGYPKLRGVIQCVTNITWSVVGTGIRH